MDDYKACPIGIKNEKEIEYTQEKFTIMVQQLTEKVDDIKNDMQAGFSSVNDKLEQLDKKVSQIEKTLPEQVDERIDQHNKNNVYNLIKWAIFTVGGSVLIAYITHLIMK